jgi:hypothetical protein
VDKFEYFSSALRARVLAGAPSSSFLRSRARFARAYWRFPHRGRDTFLSRQEGIQRSAPPDAALIFRSAALGPALSPRDFLSRGTVTRFPARDPSGFCPKPGGAQARHRGAESQNRSKSLQRVLGLDVQPRMAPPSTEGGWGYAPQGSRTGCARPGHEAGASLDRRGPQPRGAEEKGAIRGRAFFGDFLCTSKESHPWVGGGAPQIQIHARRAHEIFFGDNGN